MNYFAKTVYSIATKTCPLAAYRGFSQAKGEGAKMGTFDKWGACPLPSPRFRRHCAKIEVVGLIVRAVGSTCPPPLRNSFRRHCLRNQKVIHLILPGEHGEIGGGGKVACWSTKAAISLKRVKLE